VPADPTSCAHGCLRRREGRKLTASLTSLPRGRGQSPRSARIWVTSPTTPQQGLARRAPKPRPDFCARRRLRRGGDASEVWGHGVRALGGETWTRRRPRPRGSCEGARRDLDGGAICRRQGAVPGRALSDQRTSSLSPSPPSLTTDHLPSAGVADSGSAITGREAGGCGRPAVAHRIGASGRPADPAADRPAGRAGRRCDLRRR
jgi:hypothetical protein